MDNKLYGFLRTKANLIGSVGAGVTRVIINDHNQLDNRDLDDQHPISAITGLQDALNSIPSKTSDITNDGDGESPFATQEYVEQNGGKIDVIELNGVEQEIVNKKVSLDVDKQTVGLGNVDNTSDLNKPISTATQNALDGKVDKVNGKGLSTNDYTDEEKLKLSGIETGAEVNSIDSISAGGTPLTIDAGKNVDIPYATNSGNAGVVKIDTSYGISIGSLNQLQMQKADDNNITTRNANFRAIVPTNLNFAVKSALSDTNHLTMTSEEQTTAQQVLGVTDELNNKLDKITTSGLNRVYSITSEGQQGVFNVDDGLSNWSLARRNGSGNVKVATTPTNNNDATSKQYVDGQISNTVAIAEGKTASYTISDVTNPDFNSDNDTITLAVSGTITDIESKVISLSSLKIGDIILVTGTQLPDRWVGSIDSTNVVFYKMETSKVDLDNYYTKTQTDTLLDGKLDRPANPVRNSTVTMSAAGVVTTTQMVHESATAWSMPLRDGDGRIKVASPAVGTDAANKDYVDSNDTIKSISAGGTTLTPDADKNVNIPNADNGVYGVVKLGDSASGFINNQFVGLMLREPSLSNLQAPRGGASTQQTILLQNIATAVKYALCGSDRIGYYNNTENTGTETSSRSTPMTDAEKELAKEVLGLSGAEENTIESVSIAGSVLTPDQNKNVDIPVAGNSVKGVVDVRAFFGNEVDAYGRLSTVKASNQEIDDKTNNYKAIVPSNYTYAVSKTYLKGSGVPTTSTVAEFEGQLYLDTTNNNTYQCVAINEDTSTTPSAFTYTWAQIIRVTDKASNSVYGVVRIAQGRGLDFLSSGDLYVDVAGDAQITNRTIGRPLSTERINFAVLSALTDANHLTMTSEEQATAQSVIGVSRGIARL